MGKAVTPEPPEKALFVVPGQQRDRHLFPFGRFADRAVVRLTCPTLRLAPGEYDLDVAVHSKTGVAYDYRRRLVRFTVHSPERGVGVYFPRHRWSADGVAWSLREEDPRGPEAVSDEDPEPRESQ